MLSPLSDQLTVSHVSSEGILLTSNLLIKDACVLLNGSLFLWNVEPPVLSEDGFDWKGWDESCWRIFEVMDERPEIVVFGTGKTTCLVPPSFYQQVSRLGIQLQVEDSKNACSTYNLLAEEGMRVAAAILPYR
ncbi:DUF498-domain-containing protein [Atractiella rhizophila]|nr:DUF498-domain-containing protein [Atractiella rhizophila]